MKHGAIPGRLSCAICALSLVCFSQMASGATASATATATIVSAISINAVNPLNFGVVVNGATPGTVRLTPASVRTATGVALGSPVGIMAASFIVSGSASNTYSITLPLLPVTLSSGTDTMKVDTFISSPSSRGTLRGGVETLSVGATLNVAANQAPGTYSGTFEVTVTYD